MLEISTAAWCNCSCVSFCWHVRLLSAECKGFAHVLGNMAGLSACCHSPRVCLLAVLLMPYCCPCASTVFSAAVEQHGLLPPACMTLPPSLLCMHNVRRPSWQHLQCGLPAHTAATILRRRRACPCIAGKRHAAPRQYELATFCVIIR